MVAGISGVQIGPRATLLARIPRSPLDQPGGVLGVLVLREWPAG
jgi:hypothetical protein